MFPSKFLFARQPLGGAICSLILAATGYAQTFNTIYTFDQNGKAAEALTIDASGNLFGPSGPTGFSADRVFELAPSLGGWTYSTLYTFQGNADGQVTSTNLVMDAAGNLYGATYGGGSGRASACFPGGCGTVFKLSPDGSGGWTKTTIHNFGVWTNDGDGPGGNLATDAAGNIYGATTYGGVYDAGTAYVLKPQANGSWKEVILHHFGSTTASGGDPQGGVVLDAKGNVYGTLTSGGLVNTACPQGCGAVFELSVAGNWKQTLLHIFSGSDGRAPTGAVAFDKAGNIYSTTQLGGKNNAGVIFELTPNSTGGWKVHVLHAFDGASGGLQPFAGVVFDTKGNLYGTTAQGGNFAAACKGTSGCGLVYELKSTSTGGWSFKVLHAFDGADGYYLSNPLAIGSAGNLFGSTQLGGSSANNGTLFEITP